MKKFIIILFFLFSWQANCQNFDDYVYLEGGKFIMGSGADPDEPIHKVYVSSFYVLNHEVTNEEFVVFLNEKGNRYEGNTLWIDLHGEWRNLKCGIYEKDGKFYVREGYEKYPVVFVSWWGARAYSEWCGGRLPTEAEWEYMAKNSIEEMSFIQDTMSKYAVFKENSNFKFYPIKTKEIYSRTGLFDIFGNLSEWCLDWYSPEYYEISPKKNPMGPDVGEQKVKRGGSWATKFKSITASNRKATNPNNNNITIGFRVVIPCD